MSTPIETQTFIKKDALIPIKVGAGYLQRLQMLLTSLMDGKTTEELLHIENTIKEGNSKDDPEISNIETIIVLIKTIEDSAISNGMTEERTPAS